MTDQLIHADMHTPEFTPDTIQHLRDVRQKMLDNAAHAREQEMAWMHRATQWDVFIKQAEANAQPPAQAWQVGEGPTPCQTCGGDMWWSPQEGFVHPLDSGNWEPAGEGCTRVQDGTAVLPAVEPAP